MLRLFSKRPKTIFVRRKCKLCHKVYRMKITDFYVAWKWFYAVLKITFTFIIRNQWNYLQITSKLYQHSFQKIKTRVFHFSEIISTKKRVFFNENFMTLTKWQENLLGNYKKFWDKNWRKILLKKFVNFDSLMRRFFWIWWKLNFKNEIE